MPTLINNRQEVENAWERVDKDTELNEVLALDAAQLIVPLSLWLEHKTELTASSKEIGVWIDTDEDPYELSEDAASLPLIAVNFPVFKDGRAFSAAAILRQRLGFAGELRAIGDVLRDQLFYMKKCGIDSFEIGDAVKVEDALAAFNDFADNYQSTIENPQPLFRRR